MTIGDGSSGRGAMPGSGLRLATATIAELNAAFSTKLLSSAELVAAYLRRIAAYEARGPRINSLLCLNDRALDQAVELDLERQRGRVRGPLHGIPVVVKDNFDTADMPTTAGSQLLEGHRPSRDAFLVGKLRDAGAIVLAKTNMQEFAGGGGSVMSSRDPAVLKAGTVPSGYSSLGGQTRNPHSLDHSPSSSSGGSGAAVAAAFAQFGLGTDTVMSIRGPSSVNGIVGLKPTAGLLSRGGIVPLALSLDAPGPMARNVYDIAVAMNVMQGFDPDDPGGMARVAGQDYVRALKPGALRGARLGLVRDFLGVDRDVDDVFHAAVERARGLGATIVEVRYPEYLLDAKEGLCWTIMVSEFKRQIEAYLAETGPGYPKSMRELAAAANDPRRGYRSPEKAYALRHGEQAALDLDDPVYLAARDEGRALVRAAVDGVFRRHGLDALVYPTLSGAAPRIAKGESTGAPAPYSSMPPSHHSTVIANLAGYPDLCLPAGLGASGLPVGLSLLGPAFSEAKLLGYGYDLEQAQPARGLPRWTPELASDPL